MAKNDTPAEEATQEPEAPTMKAHFRNLLRFIAENDEGDGRGVRRVLMSDAAMRVAAGASTDQEFGFVLSELVASGHLRASSERQKSVTVGGHVVPYRVIVTAQGFAALE